MKTFQIAIFFGLSLVASVHAADEKLELTKEMPINFTKGEEFPGAEGAASMVEDRGKTRLELKYDFTQGGAYIGAGVEAALTDTFKSLKFNALIQSPCKIGVRVCDANSEWFQGNYRLDEAGEKIERELNLSHNDLQHWGGDDNGEIDQPIRAIWFIVNNPGDDALEGTATFGEITLIR